MIETLHDAIAGRVRFRVQEIYRCDSLTYHLERKLAGDPSVISAHANPLTATILVCFDPGTALDDIRSVIERGLCEFCGNTANEPVPRNPHGTAREDPPRPHTGRVPALAWHAIGVRAALAALEASGREGLSDRIAQERLSSLGPNSFPAPPRRSLFSIFLSQMSSLPVALLGVAGAISLLTGAIADAVVIGAVVAINATIGFTTENEAERTLSSLQTFVHPSAEVIRSGQRRRIDARGLVPGDLVIFEPGTYVGADCRLIEADRLQIDESSLTGESVPVSKDAERLGEADTPLADRSNLVYRGTLVTRGKGRGIVVATGRWTEMGKLQAMIGETASPQTPLERPLNGIGNQLVLVCGAVCGLVFLVGILRGEALALIAQTTISLAVASVPEGLPTVATTTLALGIRKLNGQRVIIRHLEAVETLGEIQTICFDKTGTVTENRMSVLRVFSANRVTELRNGDFLRKGRKIGAQKSPELLELAEICILCTEIDGKETEQISPTEKALLEFAGRCAVGAAELTERYPRIKTMFRTEERQFMATHHLSGSAGRLVAVKGNPVQVLALCSTRLVRGKQVPLDPQDISKIEIENERMAGEALRVLGFARRFFEDGEAPDELSGLTWLGLIGMADPVRPGMRDLIAGFHHAGIETIMLTGDQSATAYAIGKALGLSREDPIEILDSTRLTDIDSRALAALSQRVHVFARVSPAHKLQIVQALQSAGKIVAMTGDGVNDGPALKAADIGIAMGHGGTDVAREVADVVLEDDNLETMILAVGHGRSIFENIGKSLHFILSTNFSEIMVMFFAGAAGAGYPLNAMQLLWINLLSDIAPCIALALEPPEPDILDRPPRDPAQPILARSVFKRIGAEAGVLSLGTLGAYGFGLIRYGMGQKSSTLAFQSLTLAQLLHAIHCRSETVSIYDAEKLPPNRYLTMALAGSLGLQLLTFLLPGLRSLLGLAPVDLFDVAAIGAGSTLPLLVNEAAKARRRCV